jgi:hypothetical protein
MPLWADLENAVAAQIATEPAFAVVKAVAAAGLSTPSQFPAALIYRPTAIVRAHSAVASVQQILWEAHVVVLIMTRLSGAVGESRLSALGVYDLADKVRVKLLDFIPALSGMTVWPMVPKEEALSRLEAGAVDIECSYTVDIQSRT